MKLVLAILIVLAGVAHAEDRAKAEQYFRAGEQAYAAQNFAAAAMNFEEAYKLYALPEIAFSAAQAYRRQYRIEPKPEELKRAIDLYRIYLDRVRTGGRVADAADALGELQHELDKLIASGVKVSTELATEHTRLLVAVSLGKPTGARGMQEVADNTSVAAVKIVATLDGKPIEPHVPTNVPPGKHVVRAEAEGYFAAEKEELVPQGATTLAELTLEPMPAKVTIATEGGSRVSIDGRPAGTAPLGTVELAAGRHVITILHRGREPVAREIVVGRGQELAVAAPLEHTVRRTIVPWLLGGAGVTFVATGFLTTAAVLRDREAADLLELIRLGDEPPTTVTAYDDARTWRDRHTVAAITAGGITMGLVSVALLLYYTDTPSPEGIHVVPITSKDGGGAAISGRF